MIRYVPDRALPAAPYLPGVGDPPALAPDPDPIGWGLDLFHHGFPWEAHEAWEAAWLALPKGSSARARLAGMIQLAAAVVQQRLGHPRGVALLVEKAARNLAGDPALVAAIRAWAAGGPLPALTR